MGEWETWRVGEEICVNLRDLREKVRGASCGVRGSGLNRKILY